MAYNGQPYQVPAQTQQGYPNQPYPHQHHHQQSHHGQAHQQQQQQQHQQHQQHQQGYYPPSSSHGPPPHGGYYSDPYQQQHQYGQHGDRQVSGSGGSSGMLPPPSNEAQRGASRQQAVIPAQTTDWTSEDVKPPKGGPPSASAVPSSSAPTRAPSTRKKSQREPPPTDPDSDGGNDPPQPKKGPGSGKLPTVGPSEFVLKLYAMLDDPSYTPVVGWNSKGDSFIVKDLNTFGTTILPQTFRHSNFASFVRQLNKYDFHKVKGEEGRNFGDNVWEFRHPHFKQGSPDTLEQVKRKAVPPKKAAGAMSSVPLNASTASSTTQHEDSGSPMDPLPGSPQVSFPNEPSGSGSTTGIDPQAFYALQQQVQVLQQSQTTIYNHVQTLHTKYQKIISDLVNLQRSNTSTEALVGDVVQYLVKNENETPGAESSAFTPSSSTSEHSLSRLQTAVSSHHDLAGANSADSPGSSRSTHSRDGSRSHRLANGKGKDREGADDTPRGWDPAQRSTNQPSGSSGPTFQNPQPFAGQSTSTSVQHPVNPTSTLYPAGPPPNAIPSAASRSSAPHSSAVHPAGDDYSDGVPQTGADSNGSYPMFSSHQDFWNGPGGSAYQEQVRSALSEQGTILGEGVDPSGLRVFTVGHLRPRSATDSFEEEDGGPLSYPLAQPEQEGDWSHPMMTSSYPQDNSSASSSRPSTASNGQPPMVPSAGGSRSNAPNGSMNGSGLQQNGSSGARTEAAPPAIKLAGPLSGSGTSSFPVKNRNSVSSRAAEPSNAVASSSTASRPPGTLRVRRSTYVPGWSVAPRVLIVEDDAVVRKMSTKLLEVAGCTIDVAVDGVEAVNQMNLSRYDLVLMDIVMPNLDGVSATSLIRQFDDMTPIISMTSNSAPEEILSYMSSGMSGHISKPFSKEGLIGMVEKHLMHMTTVQSMSHVPRTPGVPPLSDAHIQDAVQQGVVSLQQSGPNNHQDLTNPLGGMGLADGDYIAMLQNLLSNSNGAVADGMQSTLFAGSFSGASGIGMGNLGGFGNGGGGGGKRGLEEDEDEGGKRMRFENLDE